MNNKKYIKRGTNEIKLIFSNNLLSLKLLVPKFPLKNQIQISSFQINRRLKSKIININWKRILV